MLTSLQTNPVGSAKLRLAALSPSRQALNESAASLHAALATSLTSKSSSCSRVSSAAQARTHSADSGLPLRSASRRVFMAGRNLDTRTEAAAASRIDEIWSSLLAASSTRTH